MSLMDDQEERIFGRLDDDTWFYPGHGGRSISLTANCRPHVPRVEALNEALDRATFAGGIPTLDRYEQRRADPAGPDEPVREQPQVR